MTRILALLLLVYCTYAFSEIDLSTCGVTKGCLRPSVCANDFCEFAATWRLVDEDGVEYIEFELLGDVKSSSGFISLVFSKDAYFVSFRSYVLL